MRVGIEDERISPGEIPSNFFFTKAGPVVRGAYLDGNLWGHVRQKAIRRIERAQRLCPVEGEVRQEHRALSRLMIAPGR